MKEELIKNISNMNNYNDLDALLKEDIDIELYIKEEYNKIIQEWHKKYDMFEIPSGVISIKINDNEFYYSIGSKGYNKDTIFDIASMTKYYTEFILFNILNDYKIDINTKIGDISKNYPNINNLTLLDLISFNNTYKTQGDTRKCSSREESLKVLRTAYTIKEKEGYYLYTDLPIMILTDILEEITGLTYKELFKKYIIDKYDLHDTYLDIDANNERYVTINKGFVNDPKANIFGGYYGHAGVKASSQDFINFFSNAYTSKYNYLFVEKSNTLNENGEKCEKKALMGNLNLNKKGESSIPSEYLPDYGFAIQGSVRCHAEKMIFVVNKEEYIVTSSIFLDLYTLIDSIKRYEEATNNKVIDEYVANGKKLLVSDVRKIMDYNDDYKKIVDLVGKARIITINKYINKELENYEKGIIM